VIHKEEGRESRVGRVVDGDDDDDIMPAHFSCFLLWRMER